MNWRIIVVLVSCSVVGLASCAPSVLTDDESNGGGGFGGGVSPDADPSGAAGSTGGDKEQTPDAGAGGGAGASAAGAAGDAADAGSGGVAPACSFPMLPEAPAPVDPSAPLEAVVEGDALTRLDNLVGRYLRGEVLVYRGTASAHDNASVIADAGQPGGGDEAISDGPALARLEYRPAQSYDYSPAKQSISGEAAILVLNSTLEQKRIAFSQAKTAASVTEASQIADAQSPSFARLVTSCASCAPNFWSNPKTIVLGDLTTSGTFAVAQQAGPPVNVILHTFVSARLALASPCSLTIDDLVVLDKYSGPDESYSEMDNFHLEHGEMVEHYMGRVEPPHSLYDGCWFDTTYTVDLFIDPNDLSHYGVRNFTIGAPYRDCIAV
jgi:hypothetical protein